MKHTRKISWAVYDLLAEIARQTDLTEWCGTTVIATDSHVTINHTFGGSAWWHKNVKVADDAHALMKLIYGVFSRLPDYHCYPVVKGGFRFERNPDAPARKSAEPEFLAITTNTPVPRDIMAALMAA